MTEAFTLLRLMWLASPALPVGGFSYSEGLEAAIEAGSVTNEAQAGDWLIDQLDLSLARSDMSVVAEAMHAWRDRDWRRIDSLNTWVASTRESAEFRLQAEQMGRSLVEWLRNDSVAEPAEPTAPAESDARIQQLAELKPAPTWAIAFALAAARAEAGVHEALLAYAFGWAENMVQAAMKAVPLGQAAAQRMLKRLSARIPDAAAQAMTRGTGERQAYAPMLAILSSRHETQYSRLFRS